MTEKTLQGKWVWVEISWEFELTKFEAAGLLRECVWSCRAFAPLKKPPSNVTHWDKKLLFLKDELKAHSKYFSLPVLLYYCHVVLFCSCYYQVGHVSTFCEYQCTDYVEQKEQRTTTICTCTKCKTGPKLQYLTNNRWQWVSVYTERPQ